MKKKIVIFILLVISIVIIVLVIRMLSNPLRKSEEDMRETILELTPIGMSMDDVIKVIEDKDEWKLRHIWHEYGYRDYSQGEIGVKSIRVYLGEYNLSTTGVSVFWGFDENSKLIDVYVLKESDAL